MYDASERAVGRSATPQYIAMYELDPEDVKPGTTLSEVLAGKRGRNGARFPLDPHQYRADFLESL